MNSHSFTMLLGENHAVPGMITSCSLTALVAANITIPFVDYENSTTKVNYIYVNDGTSIWDSIVVLGEKLYNLYPFVYGLNTIRLTPAQTYLRTYTDYPITSFFTKLDYSKLLSKIFMKGPSDTYEFSQESTSAVNVGVVRHKYIALDRQWLSTPEKGLTFKLAYSRRDWKSTGFTYCGFNNEQLCDRFTVTVGGQTLTNQTINGVHLQINKNGMFTTLVTYTS